MNPPKVIALSTVGAGLTSIDGVLKLGGKINHIVGIDPNCVSVESISGYVDVAEFAKRHGINYSYVSDYRLLQPSVKTHFANLDYDLIWVTGWQRLIPSWLIESCKYGAIGGHGSPDGITGGRGRSPQNWAIMLGCKSFDIALFRISQGIDDGDVISTRAFEYSKFDTIATSYQKVSLCMSKMVADVLERPELIMDAKPQTGEPFYFPQRKPDDGIIDWALDTETIFDHCRALTRPYPGLITYCDNVKILVWKCIPFDTKIIENGLINHVFNNGEFLVGCGDGRMLIQDYQSEDTWVPKLNHKLVGQKYAKTLQKIVDRHNQKYPNKKLSLRIQNLING